MKRIYQRYIKPTGYLIRQTVISFIRDNGLKLSASLAYYTIFSIAPLLFLLISLAGVFGGPSAAQNALYPRLAVYMGPGPALQLQEILKNLQLSGKSPAAVAIGIVTLFVGASGVFLEIQDSLNLIWSVKAKPKKGWLKFLENRLLSFSLIIGLGFLLLTSLTITLLVTVLGQWIEHIVPFGAGILLKLLNFGTTFLVIVLLFAIIFKFLPDVKIRWKRVWNGAIFTAILFMFGQYVINLYIQYIAKASTYGAAGSILVLLVWIYYTSMILFIGAEFTQVYADFSGERIEPSAYAVRTQPATEVGSGDNSDGAMHRGNLHESGAEGTFVDGRG